jgi:hypothetical protein
MFRLPDFLTGENVMCNGLKLSQTRQPLYYCFYLKKSRLLPNDVPYFNQCGIDGLIVKKRPGKMAIINDQQAPELAELVDQPQLAQRSFWTAKAFHFKEQLLERLDQAILDVIHYPEKTQQTTATGTSF